MGANGGGGASETEALGVGDGEEKSFFFKEKSHFFIFLKTIFYGADGNDFYFFKTFLWRLKDFRSRHFISILQCSTVYRIQLFFLDPR
jgi:hypothetical protein